jgi:TRAP-type C4-dicarboxylate transport system substrate-binding protein
MAAGFRKLRPTPWALTIAAWDVWRRLPPHQQRMLLKLARKHGPKLAARAAKAARRRPGS